MANYKQSQLEAAWQASSELFCQAIEDQISSSSKNLDKEMLFCLLGGFGISYEHGRSATEVIAPLLPFDEGWDDLALFDTMVATLSLAQFGPPRLDGSPRRYRYPTRKARIIVEARRWVLQHAPLSARLVEFPDCTSRRRFLCNCPGMGLKTASWLLRNLGWGNRLAIVDVHVLRALTIAGRIPLETRMPRDYEAVEEAFLNWCEKLSAPPPAFDLFLWEWERGAVVDS